MINRTKIPEPWSEGEKIPWNEPAFSERMLKEHLSQNHDAASRRSELIDKHVKWIHHKLLLGNPTRILDLGCGPGFYTSRLSKLGHECVGIDFSPASIMYAIDHAEKGNLHCKYIHQDIRVADYGIGYGLVMLIFGEFNVFRRTSAKSILDKANRALVENGILLLEPHSFSTVKEIGQQPSTWYSTWSRLFSDKPHLCLEENFWDSVNKIATHRYFIIDASTGNVTRHAASYQAYTNQQYRSLLAECGFEDVDFYKSLGGAKGKSQNDLIAIVARKK